MYSFMLAALMFPTRMVHSGVGLDQYPDSYLDSVAASGMSAVILYVDEPPDIARTGRVDVNDLVRRARARGLDVYAYAHLKREHLPKLHPLDPGAREVYDAAYGTIVKNAPGLKGLICVGESAAFPSRDPGMGGFWWQHEKGAAHTNGFWPASDWVDWLNLVGDVTRKYRPDFEIIFWTYNWFHAPEANRLALLERISTNVTLHVTYEMEPGIDDYSIVRSGPGSVFRSEAALAKRRRIRLTSMTNTGGRTWDFGGIPFVPVPRHWLARFRALRATHREFGLAGLMESHHYGFTPNFISDLAAVAFSTATSDADLDRALDTLAARDFGADNIAAVKAAWDEWDAAMDLHPTRYADQWGELRIGPAYPLVKIGEKLPVPPCRTSWKYVEPVFRYSRDQLAPSIDRARREVAHWQAGCDRLEALLPSVPAERRDAARKILGVGRYCERTMRTLLNHRLYCREMLAEKPDAGNVRAILRDETENVKATIPLVTADPRLGWEPSMRFVASPEILEWKLKLTNDLSQRLGVSAN